MPDLPPSKILTLRSALQLPEPLKEGRHTFPETAGSTRARAAFDRHGRAFEVTQSDVKRLAMATAVQIEFDAAERVWRFVWPTA